MKKDKIQEEQQDIELSLETGEEQGGEKESPAEEALKETIKKIKETASEEDPRPSQQVNLRTILGGDILTAGMVRSHIWLFILIVAFTIVYVAFRYQYQQDMQAIDRLETQLKDAKNKALAASSTLTEKCRESHVLEILRQNKDSLLHIADKPPYIISIPE